MNVSVSRNFGPLADVQMLSVEDWGRIGRLARERILLRTGQGKDADGAAFKPYSEKYAAMRAKAGRPARVTLQVSGEMLRGLQVQPDAEGVNVGYV